ncbi:hypothetical protein FRC00_003022 [Tulasnella sp. 408]|nr:hypothetical protein FRC00_003022 [Tulasnella sp. 408]
MLIHDRIPQEIFEIILRLCLDSEKPVHNLESLQLVCRRWRDIIAEASFLWGTITAFEGRRAFHKALRMAKNSSLDIIFFDDYLEWWDIPVGMKIDRWASLDFFTLAAEKIDQWRSLEIGARKMGEALAFIQTQNPPPKLEILRIDADNDYYPVQEGPGAVLFRGAPATQLKHVKLRRAPIHIPSLGLAGLKSLFLRHIPSATAADIVTILTNSPTLTTLRLAKFGDALLRNQPAPDDPNPSPIHLPFLVNLELEDLPLPFFGFLLSNLAVPQLRSLQVTDHPPEIVQLLALKTGNLNTTLTSVTSGARDYEILLNGDCKITIGGLVIRLASETGLTHYSMDKVDETFGGLSDHLRGLCLADLPLHLECRYYLPVLSDLEWFTRKTNVTSLTFSCGARRYDAVNTVIPLLGRPTSRPSPFWPLPQVEVFNIELGSTELRRLVVDMIKSRHTAPQNPGVLGMVPKLFREIWLYHCGDCPLPSPLAEIMTEVVQAAKGADVHWEWRKALW